MEIGSTQFWEENDKMEYPSMYTTASIMVMEWVELSSLIATRIGATRMM